MTVTWGVRLLLCNKTKGRAQGSALSHNDDLVSTELHAQGDGCWLCSSSGRQASLLMGLLVIVT